MPSQIQQLTLTYYILYQCFCASLWSSPSLQCPPPWTAPLHCLHASVPGTSSDDLAHHAPKPLHADCLILDNQEESISLLHPLNNGWLNLSCVLAMNNGAGSGSCGGAQSMVGQGTQFCSPLFLRCPECAEQKGGSTHSCWVTVVCMCFTVVHISSHWLPFLQESQSSFPIRGHLSSPSTRPPVCSHFSPGPRAPAHSLLSAQLSLPFSCFSGFPYLLTCSTLYKTLCITSYFSNKLDYLLVTSALMTHPP